MKVKDKLTVDITSVGMDGEGVARADGFVVFVPKTLVGEKAEVEITQVKKSFAFAKVIKLLSKSADRVEPKCPHCFKCGGCDMLHIDYSAQLEIKRTRVKNCLEKELGEAVEVSPTVPSPDTFFYRNKIQLPVTRVGGVAVGGYFAPGTHSAVASSVRGEGGSCMLNAEGIQGIVDAFLEYVDQYNISTYDEKSHAGLVRHLVVRKVSGEYSICVVANGERLPHYGALVKDLEQKGYVFSLYLSVNKKRTNVIMGDRLIVLRGQKTVDGEALGVKFQVSPLSFMQVNDKVRDLIYEAVGRIIKESGIPDVIDAYSGIGIMSNIFAKYAERVYSIEIVKEAVEDALAIASLNGNSRKIIPVCGDCAQELPPLIAKLDRSIVVLDPPRKGCDAPVLESILKALPTKVVYISCNPATLARDVKRLSSHYKIDSVSPYDMFPHTKHIETLLCLKRR